MFQQIIKNSGGQEYSGKVQKALHNQRSTVALAIKVKFMHKSKFLLFQKTCISTTLIIQLIVPLSIKSGLKSDNTLLHLSQLLTLKNNLED